LRSTFYTEARFQISSKKDHEMKKLIASALLLAVPALFAQRQTVSPQIDGNRRVEQEIRRLNSEEPDAFLHQDAKTLANLWSDDLVVINPLNKFVTKQQVLGMVESGFLVITSYDRSIEYVQVYGGTVIVAGSETVLWGGRMPNAGKTEHLRFTGVWMKQSGRWQEVARHANIVPQQ
jgi:ketosteroid isomerase-like protein